MDVKLSRDKPEQNKIIGRELMKHIFIITSLVCLILTGFTEHGLAQQGPTEKQPSITQEQPQSPRQIRSGLEVIADLKADITNYAGICPAQLTFTGNIYSNKATTIHYRFVRSDGTRSLMKMLNFEQPGNKQVKDTWQFDSADKLAKFSGSEYVQITFPVKATSNNVLFEIICTNREQPSLTDQPAQSVPGALPGRQIQPAPGTMLIPQTGSQGQLTPGGPSTTQPVQHGPMPKDFLMPKPDSHVLSSPGDLSIPEVK
jgi:hypothetical protein